MRSAKRTIIIGVIVWLLFFGWWFKGYLYINWRFELFSFRSWTFVFNEFKEGWRLSNTGDWIFLFSFLLSGPVFCLLWFLANQVLWFGWVKKSYHCTKKTFKKVCKRKASFEADEEPNDPMATLGATKSGIQRPARMASTSGGMTGLMGKMPANQSFPLQTNPNPWAPMSAKEPELVISEQPIYSPSADFKDIAETPLSEVELPQIESVNEDVASVLIKAGYRVWNDVPWMGKKLNWLAVAQDQLWVALYDDETGDWLADEEAFNDEDPLWFSETDHRVSPVFELKKIQKNLQNQGLELAIQPVLIERRGNLINAEDMLKTWNDLGVIVCRTEIGGPVELPTVSEVLKDQHAAPSEQILQKISTMFNLGEKVNG